MSEFPQHLKDFISRQSWRWATVPQYRHWPHAYIVRGKVSSDALFEETVLHIREHGFQIKFYWKKILIVFEEDGWSYWTMGNPLPETTIINRCRIEESWQYRLRHGEIPPSTRGEKCKPSMAGTTPSNHATSPKVTPPNSIGRKPISQLTFW